MTSKKTNKSATRVFAPIWRAVLVYLVLGYTLYFVARTMSVSPKWAMEWIEAFKPIVKSLNTAARVSDQPFSAQVVIAYVAFASILLTIYVTYCIFSIKEIQGRAVEGWGKAGHSRVKLFWIGVGGLVIGLAAYPLILFIHDPMAISWQAKGMFSPTFGSVTFLLMSAHLPVSMVSLSLMLLKLSVFGPKPETMSQRQLGGNNV